jgi:valyl-tRNA synthetase
VTAALREQGRIVAEKRPYVHAVGHCSRCDTVVEPRLSLQWFVRVAPLAKAAGDAVRDGRVRVHPPQMAARYFEWVDHMHDWCVSRQLWWGHRIPVWYGPDGEMRCLGPDEQPPGEGWTQDPDVLDTWFSSALWPFSTLGWPDDTAELRTFYPTSVLVTGYDIIFFWVARMMMFGLYAMDDREPFQHIVLTGLLRDQHGKKMSKSRGNVVDPLEWMEAYGADAARFALARVANPGADVPIAPEWAQNSRNFCNKLWNVARFGLLNGATTARPVPPREQLSAADRWILSRLQAVVADVDRCYESFEFAKVADALYQFTWSEFCDWYVELAKAPLARGGVEADATRAVLGHVLDVVLRLLHPLVPFVTEELWTSLTGGESLVVSSWPTVDRSYVDPDAEHELAAVQQLVTEVRRFRAEQGLRPGQRVPAVLDRLADTPLAAHEEQVRSLAKLAAPDADFAATAALSVAKVTVQLDLRGSIDVAAERRRLERDLAAADKELSQAGAKLANSDFLGKAPTAVVTKVRERRTAATADAARLRGQLAALPADPPAG